MKYRVVEEEVNGMPFFYPQYKKYLFWRSIKFQIRGSYHVVVLESLKDAKECIEQHKEILYKESIARLKKPIYHLVD